VKRFVADFDFKRARQIRVEGETFNFKAGEKVRLFFSYRYTPERVRTILATHKLKVCGEWIAKTKEEGVFLCRRK
jgi:uncharacterized SAM-dependent methyltransferase